MGGTPPPGDEPDDRDHGAADEEFASVVFDEDFVRNARVREPSAVERLLTAAEAARSAGARGEDFGDDVHGTAPDPFGQGRPLDPDDRYARDLLEESYGRSDAFMGHARWHRPIAWVLALVMGLGMIVLAFAAVYRGAAAGRQDPAPRPSSAELEQLPPSRPPASVAATRPPVPTASRTP